MLRKPTAACIQFLMRSSSSAAAAKKPPAPRDKQSVAQKLERLLNLRPFHALDVANKYRRLCHAPPALLDENHAACLAGGLTAQDVARHPQILAERELPTKLRLLTGLPYELGTVAALAALNVPQLVFLVDDEIVSERLKVTGAILRCGIGEVCGYMVVKKFLVRLDLRQLQESVRVLKEYNLDINDIKNDLWVLRYKPATIREKLEAAGSNNLDKLKTWMVRAKPEILEVYVKRKSDNKSVLGNSSLAEYLSQRLSCSEAAAVELIVKHPALRNKSLKKIEEILDFLYGNGFEPAHVRKVPKILLHSVETTRKRLRQLNASGATMDSLYLLTKSQKQYLHYYEALLKTVKTKNKAKSS